MALYGLGVSRKEKLKIDRENAKINRAIDRGNLRNWRQLEGKEKKDRLIIERRYGK